MKKINYLILIILLFIVFACNKDEETEEKTLVEAELISPLNNASFIQYDTINVITEARSNKANISRMYFYLNGELVTIDEEEPFNQDLVLFREGKNYISILAEDELENKSDYTNIEVYAEVIPGPVVNLNYDAPYTIYEGDSITFSISSYSDYGEITNTYLYINDELYGESSAAVATFSLYDVPVGKYFAFALAKDSRGIIGKSSTTILDVKEITPPVLELSEPYNNYYNPGSTINVSVQTSNIVNGLDRVEFYLDDEMFDVRYESPYSSQIANIEGGEHLLYAVGYDDDGLSGTSDTITLYIRPGILTGGLVTDLCRSNDADLVYALNKNTQQLMLIDPYEMDFSTIDLPYSDPISMDFSITDEKLYICYEFSGDITVLDKNTGQMSNINFSSYKDGRKIEVDENKRRIYLLTNESLMIIQQDSHEVLFEEEAFPGDLFTIDPIHSYLFGNRKNISSAYLFKYDISNDQLTEIEVNNDAGGNTKNIDVSPDGTMVVLPCGGGNGYGYTMFAFDTENVNNILGEFDIETYPRLARFSYNSEYLYATNGDGYDENLYIFNTSNYQLIEKNSLPNSDDCVDIESNITGDRVLAFTYSDWGGSGSQYVIYVFNK